MCVCEVKEYMFVAIPMYGGCAKLYFCKVLTFYVYQASLSDDFRGVFVCNLVNSNFITSHGLFVYFCLLCGYLYVSIL